MAYVAVGRNEDVKAVREENTTETNKGCDKIYKNTYKYKRKRKQINQMQNNKIKYSWVPCTVLGGLGGSEEGCNMQRKHNGRKPAIRNPTLPPGVAPPLLFHRSDASQ